MKDLIKKYLQEQVIDKVGETRPYIDPDFIDVYADDIEKLVKNNAVLPHVNDTVCGHSAQFLHSHGDQIYCSECEKYYDYPQTGC